MKSKRSSPEINDFVSAYKTRATALQLAFHRQTASVRRPVDENSHLSSGPASRPIPGLPLGTDSLVVQNAESTRLVRLDEISRIIMRYPSRRSENAPALL